MTTRALFVAIPWVLVCLRLLLAPLLLAAAAVHAPGEVFLFGIAAGFWSDVLDGVLARRLGRSTPALRRFDSTADVVFCLAVLGSIVVRHPHTASRYAIFFVFFLSAELLCQGISLLRFRQTTATHSWCCKVWGVLLFASTALLLGLDIDGWVLWVAAWVGCVAYADVLLILVLAVEPPVDVPSAWHLWRRRTTIVSRG